MVNQSSCSPGSHQFGKWEYVADTSCEQVRVCERDGCTERQIQHDFKLVDCQISSDVLQENYPVGPYDLRTEYMETKIETYKCARCGEIKEETTSRTYLS